MRNRWWRWMLGAGVLMMMNDSALASVDVCQAELAKRTTVLLEKTAKAYKLCVDSIAKEIAKNAAKAGSGFLVKGAATCEAELNKIFDIDNHAPSKSARGKFYAAVDDAFDPPNPKCTGADLTSLHHLLSPAQAPGASVQDFTKVWLAVETVRSAYHDAVIHVSDALNMIQAAIDAPPIAPGSTVAKMRTDCSLPLSCDPALVTPSLGCRPNLCQMTKIQCRTHGCVLDNAGAPPGASNLVERLGALFPADATIALIGMQNLEICQLEGFGYGLGDAAEGVLIMGTPNRTLRKVTVLGNEICLDSIAARGFCANASGVGPTAFSGHAKDYAFCQDRLAPDTCSGTSTNLGGSTANECFCEVGGGIPDLDRRCGPAHAPCPATHTCGVRADGTRCFAGTQVSPVKLSNAGASTAAGDCVILNSMQFTALSPSRKGPDGEACTNDDTGPTSAVLTMPLTTGKATASLLDAQLGTPGECTTQTNHLCIENANCATTNGADTCAAATLGTISTAILTGTPLVSTVATETSNLSGLKLVGAYPVASDRIGDLTTAITLKCQ